MIIWLVVALLVGVLLGTFTGLFPGIHINLVAATLLASLGYFSRVEPIVLVVFIVAMAITHTFVDFIPSVFLGAPEEDSFLAVLPGHQLLIEGRGFEAIVMTLYGGLAALPIVLVFSFAYVLFLPGIYEIVRIAIPYLLILVSLYLVLAEEEWILSGAIFLLAGFLGMFVFNLPVKEPLLPMLTGLFGVSGLIVSLKSKVQIPNQKIKSLKEVKLSRKDFWSSIAAGAFSAGVCSFLPGIGSGHAAVMGSEISGSVKENQRSFLFLVGMINTMMMALSFVTIYAIGKTRSGAAVAVSELLGEMTSSDLAVIVAMVLASGVLAFFAGLQLAKLFSSRISKLSYRGLSWSVIGLLLVVNLFLTNALGILVLITSSALGVFCIQSRVRRIQLMGVLLVPTILYYLMG
ncbi:tripartite tricarboxylate transporter permease [Candidatus Pacearchaeota archaeon]|nr:tripartite tricarboxylate transporter permease [Candidatus Pacearchaeota archaeon]